MSGHISCWRPSLKDSIAPPPPICPKSGLTLYVHLARLAHMYYVIQGCSQMCAWWGDYRRHGTSWQCVLGRVSNVSWDDSAMCPGTIRQCVLGQVGNVSWDDSAVCLGYTQIAHCTLLMLVDETVMSPNAHILQCLNEAPI